MLCLEKFDGMISRISVVLLSVVLILTGCGVRQKEKVGEADFSRIAFSSEGASTAYYVADHYIVVELDSDKDGEKDLILEISMDEFEKITPASYAWIRWKE